LPDDAYSLDRLQDIVVPEPVPWWPPAPFWYCFIVLATAWIVYAAIRAADRWTRNAYRRQALRELAAIQDAASHDGPGAKHLCTVSEILKRTAMVSFKREQVASLAGEDWLRFLSDTCDQVDFMKQPSRRLGTVSFDPKPADTAGEDLETIVRDARTWIAEHRSETSP